MMDSFLLGICGSGILDSKPHKLSIEQLQGRIKAA
jgi:hypothetical protein